MIDANRLIHRPLSGSYADSSTTSTTNQSSDSKIAVDEDAQVNYSLSMYNMYRQLSRGSITNDDDCLKYLIAAIQAEKPEACALYEAGTHPLYLKLYLEYGNKTGIFSPEECLRLAADAAYPDADLQLALFHIKHAKSIKRKESALNEIQRIAEAGNPNAATEFFRINYASKDFGAFKSGSFFSIYERDKAILESIHHVCGQGIYQEKLLELAKLYYSMASTLLEFLRVKYDRELNSLGLDWEMQLEYGDYTNEFSDAVWDEYGFSNHSTALLKIAAKLGNLPAMCELVRHHGENVTDCVDIAHQKGHENAGVILGDLYMNRKDADGYIYNRKEKAIKCYKIAIEYGNTEATCILGEWYLTRSRFWTTAEEIDEATKLLARVQSVPDKYPKLQKLFATMTSHVGVAFSIQ